MPAGNRGFLMVTVLLVVCIVAALGAILFASASQDLRFAEREVSRIQAEEAARSGVAYYLKHGIPPLVNGKPEKLRVFPDGNRTLEISREGNTLKFTGTIWDGSSVRGVVSYRVPLWNLSHVEKVP